jgi:hypothetical protein
MERLSPFVFYPAYYLFVVVYIHVAAASARVARASAYDKVSFYEGIAF